MVHTPRGPRGRWLRGMVAPGRDPRTPAGCTHPPRPNGLRSTLHHHQELHELLHQVVAASLEVGGAAARRRNL